MRVVAYITQLPVAAKWGNISYIHCLLLFPLSGADLSDADLRSADFSLANVTKVIFFYFFSHLFDVQFMFKNTFTFFPLCVSFMGKDFLVTGNRFLQITLVVDCGSFTFMMRLGRSMCYQ